MFPMIPLPSFETERLLLRPLKRSDAKAIYEYSWRDDVGPRAGWAPHQSIKDTKRFIEYALSKPARKQPGVYAVILKAEKRLIGTMEIHSFFEGFKAEIGMVCHPAYQNRGYMHEASKAAMVYAFEFLNLRRLGYSHYPDNKPSERLREKLGFTYEGTLRNFHKRYDGQIVDFVTSSFTDDDYLKHYDSVFEPFKKTLTVK